MRVFMARESLTGGFDSITRLPVDATLYRRVALREHPRVTWTDRSGTHELLLTERIAVGSAPGNAIEVADATVSRIHAELDPRDGSVWMRDLGSRNGTFVESVRVAEAEVPDGGTITVGSTKLRVERNARRAAIDQWPTHQFGTLVGRSTAMHEPLLEHAASAASQLGCRRSQGVIWAAASHGVYTVQLTELAIERTQWDVSRLSRDF